MLDYKLAPDVMVYGSVAEGYQAGGFSALNVPSSSSNSETKPETMWSYETGFKSYFRPQHLTINTSHLLRTSSPICLRWRWCRCAGSAVASYQVTTSDQTAIGADIDVRWQPTHDFRSCSSSLNIIDQEIWPTISPRIRQRQRGTTSATSPPERHCGRQLAASTATQRGVWGGSVNYSLQDAYTGATRCNASSAALGGNCFSTQAFTLGTSRQRTDARIAWDADGHKWGVALYANNLLNKRYVDGIDTTSAQSLGVLGATITAPRIVGVEVHASM